MIGGIKLPLMAKPFKVLISWFLETSFTSKFNSRMFVKDLPSLNNLKCFEKKQIQAERLLLFTIVEIVRLNAVLSC